MPAMATNQTSTDKIDMHHQRDAEEVAGRQPGLTRRARQHQQHRKQPEPAERGQGQPQPGARQPLWARTSGST
jgi:hypothetical protein